MPDVPQVIPLVGSTATGVPIDATGVQHDGESRLSWPYASPSKWADARFVVAGDATQTDATVDLILRDYEGSTDVVSITGTDADSSQFIAAFDPDELDGTADVGLRVDVTTASGTGGATVDLDAKIVLRP